MILVPKGIFKDYRGNTIGRSVVSIAKDNAFNPAEA
jgi:hypothetical protein